jgi:hypothetical protein
LTEVAVLKLAGNERAIVFPHPAKVRRIQQLQQQIEEWKVCWKSWEGMNERSHPFILQSAITRT